MQSCHFDLCFGSYSYNNHYCLTARQIKIRQLAAKVNLVLSSTHCILAQMVPYFFKQALYAQKVRLSAVAALTHGVLSLAWNLLSECMFPWFDAAVISVQTMNLKGYRYQGMCMCFSLFLAVCECLGIATQTEATLISVLESNLACVQNGSLYQLGGSLPCLESGGSRSRCGSDASLVTAEGASAQSPSPEARCAHRKDKQKTFLGSSTALTPIPYQ